ncbi:putative phosphoinositide phospholipase C [Helianthus annuus]|nr:putative phosphoinositide phospholipase C [Helianthus annuus]
MVMGNYRVCYCFIRKFKATQPDPPADVISAFNKYSGDGIRMTADQLRRFLEDNHAGDDADLLSDAERIVDQIVSKRKLLERSISRRSLSLEDFHDFLFSTELNPPIRSQVHQDMTAPLSHYFIYTGHNSYLTGNQLSSSSSEKPIIKALKRGVRVIELDLWPNSSKDDIHVLHGRTLTSPVNLMECLKAIKEYAFVASPYPVIITFEDHLTPDLQAKVAKMVTETFGSMLFSPESDNLEELPTPENLKNRILISTKPPKECVEAEDVKCSSSEKRQVFYVDDGDDAWSEDGSSKSGSDCSDQDVETEDLLKGNKPSSSPVYKKLIAIHAGKPKKGLKDALKVEKDKVRRLSLAEQALEKAAENHGQDVVRFTEKNILRIYPKGTRITSSNYKPLICWLHGAQMVAFNMQGYGRSLWLMHGMFRANGNCGYVKKPDFLMSKNEVFDPKAKLPPKTSLKVKIYMGDGWHLDFKKSHFDKYSPPDFYTRVGIAGASVDNVMKRTKIKDDSWTPVWNEEFTFPLAVPELALLRIEVHDSNVPEKDTFAGQLCLPVSELRPGIRAIPLCNRKGDQYASARPKRDVLPDDIKQVIDNYSENGKMNVRNLNDFLKEMQGQSDEDPHAIFEKAKHHNLLHHKGLDLLQFLFSDFNHPLSPILDDMKSPISHYYIYTSHNTYLTGNQFTSDSSVRPIIRALQKGVRGIELDLWPNSTNTDVNVCHGRTLTSSVKLRKCLNVIKEYAFYSSDYPVIITFEDHLNRSLRAKVAIMVKNTFGDMLVQPKKDSKLTKLPSPADLKRKIVISTKPPNESMESETNTPQKNVSFATSFNCFQSKDDSDENSKHEEIEMQGEVPEYRDLIAIHAVKHQGDLHDSLRVDPNNVRRLSLSEQELVEACKEHGHQIERFTQNNILRVYPKGTRLDSSNYNAYHGWKHGAQMVAFNMQGYGKNLWLMQGMFRANKGCGYVKKPKFLCEGDPTFYPNEVKKILKVKVYMGEGWHLEFHHAHFDYCSPPDFYAKVGVAGYEEDKTPRMYKTKSIEDDWWPIWDEVFEFPIRVPELALLRIEVKDNDTTKKHEFGGQTCLPVSELRSGIRCVPLYNRKGEKYKFIKLLMHFEFTVPISDT